MLHTNFQGHLPFGSGEEGFLRFNHIWTWRPCDLDRLNIIPQSHGRAICNLTLTGKAVSKEMFKECGQL